MPSGYLDVEFRDQSPKAIRLHLNLDLRTLRTPPNPINPNPKPQTLNPKPQTLNPEPQTLNPINPEA